MPSGGTGSDDPVWNRFPQAHPWEETSHSQEMRTVSGNLTVASCGNGKLHAALRPPAAPSRAGAPAQTSRTSEIGCAWG